MPFVDTNVLLYAVSGDPQEREKAAIAIRLLEASDLAFSVQVFQEFYAQATRPTRMHRLPPNEAQGFIESWLRFPVQEVTVDILRAALRSSQRYQISYWDAAILEAARALKCTEVLSEDLSDRQNYGGIAVVNPFQPRRGGARSRR